MYTENVKVAAIPKTSLPKPQGYKILIELPVVQEKTQGGIILPDKLKGEEQVASIIGRVVALGPEAYKDEGRTSYSWCKEGDWVIFRSYSGTRFKVGDTEFRLINDDTVEAVVDDPAGYKRA